MDNAEKSNTHKTYTDLINSYGLKLPKYLPDSAIQRKSVNQLYNSPSSAEKESGAWLLTLDKNQVTDKAGWLVLCWPQILRRMLSNPYHRAEVEARGIDTGNIPPVDFDYIWLQLEEYFLKNLCLPGAVYHQEHYPFNKLTQHIPDYDKATEGSVTVLRLPDLMAPRGPSRTARRAMVLNNLGKISEDTLRRSPSLLRLLTIALRRSALEGCQDPFKEWGVAWVKGHLYFHYGRALRNLMMDMQYDTGLGLPFTEQMVEWSEPSRFARVTGVSKNLLLQSTMLVESLKQRQLTDPIKALYPEWDEIQYFDEYHEGNCAVFDVDKLCKLLGELVAVSENPLLLAVNQTRSKSRRKLPAYPQAVVKLDAIGFGYELTDRAFDYNVPVPLTMHLAKVGSQYYLSMPDEFADLEPYLLDRYIKLKASLRVANTAGKMERRFVARENIEKNTKSVHYVANRLYFNLALLKPGGELNKLVSMIYEVPRVRNNPLDQMIKAYEKFLQWLEDAAELESDFSFAGELRDVVTKEEETCPVHLVSKEDRVAYLFNRGHGYTLGELSYITESHTTTKRSPALTNYDHYAIWRATEKEMPVLGKQLTKKQQAQYIAQRWLPWQRAIHLETKIPGVVGLAVTAPRLERTEEAMTAYLNQATELLGVVS